MPNHTHKEPVLKGATGGRINHNTTARLIKKVGAKSEIPGGVNLHLLRHSYASYLAMGGAELVKVQALLGHTSIATTQRYAHLSPSSIRDAATRVFGAFPGKADVASDGEPRAKAEGAGNGADDNDPANRASGDGSANVLESVLEGP